MLSLRPELPNRLVSLESQSSEPPLRKIPKPKIQIATPPSPKSLAVPSNKWNQIEKNRDGPFPYTLQFLTIRALEIARRKKAEGDIPGAIKFAKKSQSLYSTPEADDFLAILADLPSTNGSAFASGTSTPTAASAAEGGQGERGATQRKKAGQTEHRQGRQNVEYTREQVTIVERVRKCKHHQYYEILELKTEATDAEVKKRYLIPRICGWC